MNTADLLEYVPLFTLCSKRERRRIATWATERTVPAGTILTPRTATVVADLPMQLLVFEVDKFRRLLDEMPSTGDRIIDIAQRPAEVLRGLR